MTGLVLTLFGPPSARTGEAPAALPAKALGLLAYLALEPGNHTRESLAALFWGESDDDSARTSLRQALKHIRDALGDVIRADRHSVCLAVPVDCDLRRFLEVSRAEPHAAVRYDVPHLFAGLVVRDAPAFDEWMDTMRRHALRRYIDALREEARSAVTRSRWRHALELAEQWLGSDPLSEEATGVAMEALYCQGSRAAALERFREYRDRLKKEIGSRPGEALADLARRIEHAAGVAEPASEGEGTPRFEADLVGREAQWLELVQVWGAVPSGARSAVLVGEAGIGKTRLAEEFTRWAMARGATLLRGQGYKPSGEAPFGPIASALRDTLTAPGLAGTDPEWLAEVARVVPELNRRFPRLPAASASPGLERIRLFEGVAQILTSLAAERPTILFLDDLQWCEGESCALVSFLRRRLEAVPVLFLATVTAGELVRGTPAEQLAEELGTRPGGQTIAVTPLGEAEVWQLVRQMGNIRTPTGARRFARRLYEVSDGNPFQVIEVTKLLFSEGLLAVTPVSREWVIPPDVDAASFAKVEIPRSVREAIGKRITRLPYELRDLLASIASAMRPVRIEVISRIHGMSRLRVAALADALVERHLVEERDGSYRMAHPLLGDYVVASLSSARRTELHRAISLALEEVARPERLAELAGEIAWHAEQCGDAERAYRFALSAADAAQDRLGFEEALSWLHLAARAIPEALSGVNEKVAALAKKAGWKEIPNVPRSSGPIEFRDADVDLRVGAVG